MGRRGAVVFYELFKGKLNRFNHLHRYDSVSRIDRPHKIIPPFILYLHPFPEVLDPFSKPEGDQFLPFVFSFLIIIYGDKNV